MSALRVVRIDLSLMKNLLLSLFRTSFDRTARLWNADNGTCLREMREHSDSVYSLCFSPDARFMATGGIDHRVFITRVEVSFRFPSINDRKSRIRDRSD